MADKKILAVIPSRLGSTRLHGKALLDINGKTLVQRCWDSASESKLIDKIVVATDADVIMDEVKAFGGECLMTSDKLINGSQRVLQSACILSGVPYENINQSLPKLENDWDIIVNFQGDMPFLSGKLIDKAINFFKENDQTFSLVTIGIPICSEEEFLSPHLVKVVVSSKGEGLYFSRSPIPYDRDHDGQKLWPDVNGKKVYGFLHLGLYLYKPRVLSYYAELEPSCLESNEKLEQLRVLERGDRIGVMIVDPSYRDSFTDINVEADLEQARKIAKSN